MRGKRPGKPDDGRLASSRASSGRRLEPAGVEPVRNAATPRMRQQPPDGILGRGGGKDHVAGGVKAGPDRLAPTEPAPNITKRRRASEGLRGEKPAEPRRRQARHQADKRTRMVGGHAANALGPGSVALAHAAGVMSERALGAHPPQVHRRDDVRDVAKAARLGKTQPDVRGVGDVNDVRHRLGEQRHEMPRRQATDGHPSPRRAGKHARVALHHRADGEERASPLRVAGQE